VRNDMTLRAAVARGVGAAIEGLLAQSPRMYIRDSQSDAGDPHAEGLLCRSPDVILRQAAIDLTDTTHEIHQKGVTLTLDPVESGQVNYVYVRIYNKGASAAAGTRAHLYYTPATTLAMPALWNPIGVLDMPDAPPLPGGDAAPTVGVLEWTPPQGVTGHFCLVCVLTDGSLSQSELTAMATGWSFPEFARFIRTSNRAAWRNFQMVNDLADAPATGSDLLIAGAHDEPLAFRIVLGLSAGDELLLNQTPTVDLPRLASAPRLIAPRWIGHPRYWRLLVRAAAAGGDATLQRVHCAGICMVVADLWGQDGRPPDRPGRARRR